MSTSRGTTSQGERVVRPTAPRRHLSERQADTVARLTEATVQELRQVGFDGLTVRNVARRAGVAPATAYTYFASREHLVTEVYRRRFEALPEPVVDPCDPPAARVTAALGDLGILVADEPELAAACTVAMLASDPEVARVRDVIARRTSDLLRIAAGPEATPAQISALDAAFSGLQMQAGVGHISYRDVPTAMAEIAGAVLGTDATSDEPQHTDAHQETEEQQ